MLVAFRWRRRWTAYMYMYLELKLKLYLYPNLRLWMGRQCVDLWHGRGNTGRTVLINRTEPHALRSCLILEPKSKLEPPLKW
ncbi:uncharacterized protein Dere_GG27113 [Drosophila erecta]|uniref:Uncharacterized protein n=1 Tax=Drosophila erecta TaxID=7220 RepID=A0A0Q5U438_DROER|nr:uncharacterized protein Dere_GG27113 [Drosophila erecta]